MTTTLPENPLFGDAAPERIVKVIASDWRRFSAAASVVLGERATWEAAVREFDLLSQVFYRDRRDMEPLGEIFELLLERAYHAGSPADREARLMYMSETLGDEMPGLAWAKRRAAYYAEQMALSPDERQRRTNKAWLDAYRADRAANA